MTWSTLLAAAAAAAFATPAYADPPLPGTVPDAGTRPVPAGTFQLPGAAPAPGTSVTVPIPSTVTGPLATAIYGKEIEVATLGDQLLGLRQDQATAQAELDKADLQLRAARDALAKAQELAESAAADALRDAAGLPPGIFGSDLHELDALSRLQYGRQTGTDTSAAAREVARARSAEQSAYEAFATAENRARSLGTDFTTLDGRYKQAEAALLKLKRDNAAQLAVIEREQEALEQRLGASFLDNSSVAGMTAHPRAVAAVRYALAQRGDPYLWGAEGPNQFDCSGLMWAAYRSKGADYFYLPRVAKDQYYATRSRSVARSSLLPGDLIFFASGPSWTTIHHVGMYIGGGKMVHAPTSGDVVKVSTVRWSRFYAATRIFDAVPAPTTAPTPTPTPTPTPRPSPAPIPPPRPTPPRTTPPTTPPSTPPTTSPTTPPTTTPTTTPTTGVTPSPQQSTEPSSTTQPAVGSTASAAAN